MKIEIDEKTAEYLELLANRMTWDDARRRAENDAQAYAFLDAMAALSRAIGEAEPLTTFPQSETY